MLLFWPFVSSILCVFQEQEVVNIKLSDYGISRQSFHEGVLGVEGTPGYQAPEVRPGIVYDEKVQIIMFCCSVFRWHSAVWEHCEVGAPTLLVIITQSTDLM